MASLPIAGDPPLIRTDFSDDAAWEGLLKATRTPSPDGFLANLQVIDGRQFDRATPEEIGKSASSGQHPVLFIADETTMTHQERPILCLNGSGPQRIFRVIPSELWGVENNLSLANMDFDDFADSVEPDGIFRGF